MSKLRHEINDDEIRIISSDSDIQMQHSHSSKEKVEQKKNINWTIWLIIGSVILIGALAVFFWWEVKKDTEESITSDYISYKASQEIFNRELVSEVPVQKKTISRNGYVEINDTVINKAPLTIFVPKNSVPRLKLGVDALKDTTAVFVVPAADVRKDNGQIVGSYVYEGNLLSRGQSKAGFCAIINGKLIIGVADSTPYLEQAIESGGYFFRQYPLVVGGQAVENKLKLSSFRKALAELNGEIVVIMNHEKQTLNEFANTLIDIGVINAIYLVGSTAPGFAIEADGKKIEFGKEIENIPENANYIVWQ